MTYIQFIEKILTERGRFGIPDDEYKERHHIKPKCMGGGNEEENLIDLYAREHFIAHKLLALENADNIKLLTAFLAMSNFKSNVNREDVRLEDLNLITPDEYEKIRISYIDILKQTPQKEETNIKRSNTVKSKNLAWYFNGTEEHRFEKNKQSEGYVLGRKPISEETRQKYKNRPKPIGEKNGMYGKKNSPESNKLRSEWSSARSWFNNGIDEVFEKECPVGYVSGRLSGKLWYTNGIEEVQKYECPNGFWRGRLKKHGKNKRNKNR